MKSIFTKYLPATNTRGSRIKAYDSDKCNSITLPYDDALSTDYVHRGAALALCHKLGWTGTLVEGGSDTGNVYVFLTDYNTIDIH